MLSERHLAFLSRRRIGHLATAASDGAPHLVPACFAAVPRAIYTAIDGKPKSSRTLKRLDNIRQNPRVAFLADCYDEDWSRLGWLRFDGVAQLLCDGGEFAAAVERLKRRYPQYESMYLSPVIAIRARHICEWGDLGQ